MYYNKRDLKIRHSIQKKLKKLILSLLDIPFIIPVLLFLLLIRLIRPLVIIRIGIVDVTKIGRIYPVDFYLSERLTEKNNIKYFDIFYFDESSNHVNQQWVKMWKRAVPYLPCAKFWSISKSLNRLIPGYEVYEIPDYDVLPTFKEWQIYQSDPSSCILETKNIHLNSILNNIKPNILFDYEEELVGQKTLERLGIPKEKKYICFHARDSAYLDEVRNNIDWSYHNYRDSRIQNYILSAEEMTTRGYFSIRMGAIGKEKFHSLNPHVIDYTHSTLRTDFNDIYVGSHCHFFLCSDTGISIIPEIFRIPTVFVNWTQILRITNTVLNGLFIFKKFLIKNENRFMSFSEIIKLDFGGKYANEIFSELDLKLIENTPEEIRDVTIEMDERLNGTWKVSKEDEELQARFWSLFGPDKLKSQDLHIGADFLRQNKDLIN